MNFILITVLMLGLLGAVSAIILYFVAQKFKVEEDARIDLVAEILPLVNCGGCGFAGCRAFAEACVKADSLDNLLCPVGGNVVMEKVAHALGKAAVKTDPKIAVVRCNGTCENRPKMNQYDGAVSCAVAANLYAGETQCSFGCLGLGDCEVSCQFDAIHINAATGLPVVDEDKCTSCGACVKACPKLIIELRKKGLKSRRIYVNCINKDKGAVNKKACAVACIACGKCKEVCEFEAITIENNLAYIDYTRCRLCRKCAVVCPTSAIVELNFQPRNPKLEKVEEIDTN